MTGRNGNISKPLVRKLEGFGPLSEADKAILNQICAAPRHHKDDAGMWFLEAGFGRLNLVHPPTFVDLDKAQDWILRQLGSSENC